MSNVKAGQRKFLLNAGYTEEQVNKMTQSKAHSIISNINKVREREKQIELEKERQIEEEQEIKQLCRIGTSCIICKEYVALTEDEAIILKYEGHIKPKLCDKCRELFLQLRKDISQL